MLMGDLEAMRLHEIYEGIQFTNVMDVAERIVELMRSRKFGKPMSATDWQWLKLTCENQSVLRKLNRACSRYISYSKGWNDIDSEFLRSGSLCAEAVNYLREIKQDLDDEAKTAVLQATDEVMNSEEMAELAKQQAYVDLQNSYEEAQTDSAKRVGALADMAVDI